MYVKTSSVIEQIAPNDIEE